MVYYQKIHNNLYLLRMNTRLIIITNETHWGVLDQAVDGGWQSFLGGCVWRLGLAELCIAFHMNSFAILYVKMYVATIEKQILYSLVFISILQK